QPNIILPAGGKYGVDIDMPAAWSITTGKMTTVVAIMDTGADYTDADVYLNIWLNQGEIPAAPRPNLTDTDGDGLISSAISMPLPIRPMSATSMAMATSTAVIS